jgi:large subunit ribosomal protein L25
MNESTVIHSILRETKGKSAVKKLHAQGFIPAVVYGHNFDPLKLSVNAAEINRIFRLGHEDSEEFKICKLSIDNKGDIQDRSVIIKEIQKHPLTNSTLHVDFFVVRMDEKIVVPVHIRLTGKAEGVKLGGIQRQILREVKVKSLPSDIPPHFEIDVSELQIGDSIHISYLEVPENVQILADPNAPVVSILAPTVEKEEEVEKVEAEVEAEAEAEEKAEQTPETDTKE